MKKQVIISTLLCILSISSYAQVWTWAKSGEGSGNGEVISVDSQGNKYMAGHFTSSTMIFDDVILTNSGNNGYDVFLVKYDVDGNVLWAKNLQGTGDSFEFVNSIVVDDNGNLYMAGTLSAPTDFGGIITNFNGGSYDAFLAKYSTDGDILWVKTIGGNSEEQARSISMDNSSNIILTGFFKSATLTVGTTTLANNSNTLLLSDIFIVKYDQDGNVLWAKDEGGSSNDTGISVAVDDDDNIFLLGDFISGSITFGSTTLENAWVTEGTFQIEDVFLTKFNANGEVLWAKSAYGRGRDISSSVAVDDSNNVIITGTTNSNAAIVMEFDTIELPIANDVGTFFIAKYDTNGNIQWAKTEGGDGDDRPTCIITDSESNIYVTGIFDSSTLSIGSIDLINNGDVDICLIKYSSDGETLWAKGLGGSGTDGSSSLAVDSNDDVYLAGYFRNSCSFDAITLINTDFGADAFIAKLSQSTVGVEILDNDMDKFSIFPNPSSGIFHINPLNTHLTTSNFTINIYNVVGDVVYSSEFIPEINLSNLHDGFYIVNIAEGTNRFTEVLIIH